MMFSQSKTINGLLGLMGLILAMPTLAGTLYSVDRSGPDFILVEIDTDTFQLRQIGSLVAQYQVGGLAWDPENQTLYMVTHNSEYLWTIDPATGKADIVQQFGPLLYYQGFVGLAYDCRQNLLVASGQGGGFYSVDPQTATVDNLPKDYRLDYRRIHALTYNQTQEAVVGYRFSDNLEYAPDALLRLYYARDDDVLTLAELAAPDFAPDIPHGLAYDPDKNVYWAVLPSGALISFDPSDGFRTTTHRSGLGSLYGLTYRHSLPCEPRPFQINYGLTDAWYDREMSGQGFFFNVFPATNGFFTGWFTFDVDTPPAPETALLGHTAQRWLTAQGTFEDSTAILKIYNTEGGAFTSGQAVDTTQYGEMTIDFDSCEAARVQFSMPGPGLSDTVHLTRLRNDRLKYCLDTEFLTQPAP